MDNEIERIVTPGQLVLKRFLRNKLAIVGISILVIMVLLSFLGPLFVPYSETQVFYRGESGANVRKGPGTAYVNTHVTKNDEIVHVLGTALDAGGASWMLVEGNGFSGYIPSAQAAVMGADTLSQLQGEQPDAFVLATPKPKRTYAPIVPSAQSGAKGKKKAKPTPTPEPTPLVQATPEPAADLTAFPGFTPMDGWAMVTAKGERLLPTDDISLYGVLLDKKGEIDAAHLLGTDNYGRDVLARIFYGGQVSLRIGLIVVLIEVVLGCVLGGIAGFYGGAVDNVIMRIVDVFFCVPSLPVQLILGSVLLKLSVPAEQKINYLMLVLGFLGWASVARMVRGQILSLREQEYMLAAEAGGIRPIRRIFKHLLPNVMPILIVISTMGIGETILTEAALSYLSLGVPFPLASWGNMVNAVQDTDILTNFLNIWVPPGLCILLTVLAFNFVGDGLRDAFDPKMKR